MALRAFQSNPSVGGFGGENESRIAASQSTRIGGRQRNASGDAASRRAQGDFDTATNNDGDINVGGCGAFAQIVKELVDNAVDACASPSNDSDANAADADQEQKSMKRVRVHITSATIPVVRHSDDGEDTENSSVENTTMDCLRVEICDNGCGMENIDDCVTAFRSNKNGGATRQSNGGDNGQQAGEKSVESTQSKATKKKGGKKQTSSQNQPPSDNNENYTSGRYGVGLTLCLLHAQRLVPGTGASITSATASAKEWTRAVYEADIDADNIVCKKKEQFPKEVEDECGTTISLYVPGEEAARAWPRLAEYFARFQLSIDLPCSLEVKAPTLQNRPLYVRPPAEIERRMIRKRNMSLTADLMSDANNDDDGDEGSNIHNWEGGDGFDEGNSVDDNINPQPKPSKAARRRAEEELQKKKRISLIHKAASAYKGRADLKVENVAHTTQTIRRSKGSGQTTSSKDGPVLEISFVVFGPEPNDGNDDDENSDHEPRSQNAKLQVVRMVNGIPLLDSSEALACGVVQKVSNNAAAWNSFGLTVAQKTADDLDPVPLDERSTPTFEINDSAQVAPFLKSTTHSMFQEQSQDYNQSSSDDDDNDDFDMENIGRRKRKKERKVRCILPANMRLGDVLMVVQIRAKPSALPLPTLSKGRLPLNDKGISDALENGIADCLRCLQRSSPGLLLTAHQLKRVERDVKYVPAVAGAISSVLCRSKKRGVSDNVMNIASGWDVEVKKLGVSLSRNELGQQRTRQSRSTAAETSNDPLYSSEADDERLRVDTLRPILERRLRYVISDEYRDAKKADENERRRREREEIAASKKRAKSKTSESDGMDSGCFESDGDGRSGNSSVEESERNRSPKKTAGNAFRDDFESDTSSPVVHNNTRRRHWKGGSVGSSEHSSVGASRRSPEKLSCDDVDSERSSPVVQSGRWNRNPAGRSSPSRSVRREGSPLRSSCDDGESMSSPVVNSGRHRWRGDPEDDDFDDGYESSPRLSNDHVEEKEGNSVARREAKNRHGGNPLNDKFQRKERSLSVHNSPGKASKAHDDSMSSDSEWSSQYGEMVSGHFFN